MSALKEDSPSGKTALLQKGKYVFTELLQTDYNEGSSIPYFYAKAIFITGKESLLIGDTGFVNLSDLILKQSTFIDDQGKSIEAHKLYTWPRNLGSTNEWTASKREFLEEFIMNFPIEILSLQDQNGLTWRYISPENFKTLPENISMSDDFSAYAAHQEEYFFLRRTMNDPK